MKQVLFFLSTCLMIFVQSCSSDQDSMYLDPVSQESEISHMVVKYNGRTYETEVKTVGDSVIYLNEEYAEVYRSEIALNENLATIVSTDDAEITFVTYYNSEDDLLQHYNMRAIASKKEDIEPNGVFTRWGDELAPTNALVAIAELYRNTDFGGKCIRGTANTFVGTAIQNLDDVDFGDKTSSIKLINKLEPNLAYTLQYRDVLDNNRFKQDTFNGSTVLPVLICYEHKDYKGKVLYCVGNPAGSATDHEDKNLKKLKFNDIISSFSFAIINRSEFNKGAYEGYIHHHN